MPKSVKNYGHPGPEFTQLLRQTRMQQSVDMVMSLTSSFQTAVFALVANEQTSDLQTLPLLVVTGVAGYYGLSLLRPDSFSAYVYCLDDKDPVDKALRDARRINTLAQISTVSGIVGEGMMLVRTDNVIPKVLSELGMQASLFMTVATAICAVRAFRGRVKLNNLIKQHKIKPLCEPV